MIRSWSDSKIQSGLTILALSITTLACGGKNSDNIQRIPGQQADTLLLDRGMNELEDEDWEDARGYFQQLLDTYPRSQLAGDARLGVADSYFYQRGAGNKVLAIAEYRDFLTFFPNHPRADYAQYQIAMGYYDQMHSSDRDQTPTRTAIDEFEKLIELYRNSLYAEEGRKLLQECKDRLADSEFNVGLFYYKTRKACRASIARFEKVIASHPTFSENDKLYYYLAQSLEMCQRTEEALPYYEKVIENYPDSDFREESEERLRELQNKSTENGS